MKKSRRYIFRTVLGQPWFVGTIAFLLALAISSSFVWQLNLRREETFRAQIANIAADHAHQLQVSIERSLSAAYVLEAIVRQGRGSVANFKEIASHMISYYPGVSSLSLSPDGIIKFVVPLAGNEKSIGFNAFANSDQAKEAQIALQSRKLTFAGPFEQVQGGLAAYGRLPVFLDEGKDSSKFWGFVSVGMLFPEALAPARLAELIQAGMSYELWRIHPDTGKKQTIASSSSLPSLKNPIYTEVVVPNGVWTLSVAPNGGWTNLTEIAFSAFFGLIFSVLCGYLFKLASEQKLLRRRLEVTIEAIPDIFWSKDMAGFYVSCNRQFERFCGLKKIDIIGKKDAEVSVDDHADFLRTSQSGEEESSRVSEEWLTFADRDQPSLFEIIETPVRDAVGNPMGVLAIARDITERKQAIVEIERHRTHLQELVSEKTQEIRLSEAAAHRALADLRQQKDVLDQHAAVAITDLQGLFTYVNEQFSRLSGYSREELVGQSNRILQSDYHGDQLFADINRHVAEGNTWHGELCNRAKDGSVYWLDCTVAPFRDENGKIFEYVALATDISARKIVEVAAEAANRAKAEFLANMSHEIRTPLSAVMGLIEILEHSDLSLSQRDILQKIGGSSLALLGILNDILDFSKIEAGKLSIELIPVQIPRVVDDIVQTLAVVARKQEVDLRVVMDPALPQWMLADAGRIRQILFNLLGNAIKFTAGQSRQQSQVSLTVTVIGVIGRQVEVRFAIYDNGIGISEENIAKLFTPFLQADQTTTRRFGGTGLGLSITKRLVTAMGGKISVRSVLGEGTEFDVDLMLEMLPVDFAVAVTTVEQNFRRLPASEPLPTLDQQKRRDIILIAEDSEINREVIQAQLSILGYSSEIATDGIEALEMWLSGRFSMLITDCHMPNMDGFQLAATIRKHIPHGFRFPIIAITADVMAGAAEKCLQNGMDDYLAKPVSLAALAVLLEKWLMPNQNTGNPDALV